MATLTNKQKCENAVKSLQPKYPSLLEEFNNWYTNNGWEEDTLQDEFLEDITESDFIDWLKDNDVISTDEEANHIFTTIQNSLKPKATNTPNNNNTNSKPSLPSPAEDGSGDQKSSLPDIEPQPPSTGNLYGQLHIQLSDKESAVVSILNTIISNEERQRYITDSESPLKQQIKETAPTLLPVVVQINSQRDSKVQQTKAEQEQEEIINKAQDILFVEYLGRKNGNYPLLIHFVDSWVRCKMNEWVSRGIDTKFKEIPTHEFFAKYCKHRVFRKFIEEKSVSKEQLLNLICTAMQSYKGRLVRPFDASRAWAIHGDVLDLVNYLFEMARVVRNCANQPVHNLASIVPIQIEFMVINKRLIPARPLDMHTPGISQLFDESDEDDVEVPQDDDDDDDEEEDEQDEQIPEDVASLLKKQKIKFNLYETNPLRQMFRCSEDIKRCVDNKRCKRTVFIVDRRKNVHNKGLKNADDEKKDANDDKKEQAKKPNDRGDKVYLFKPVAFDEFEENEQQLVHAQLHHNSIMSIVPRPTPKSPDYGVLDSLRGKMLVFSFHIMSKEEIRCYLFYQGQCFRFFGEDLFNVLPMFFSNKDKAKRDLSNKYQQDASWKKQFEEFCATFMDIKFEAFYHGLTAKCPRIDVVL